VAAYGHFRPLLPLARAFSGAGHEVAFATSSSFAARVEASGFPLLPAGIDEQELADQLTPFHAYLASVPPGERRPLLFTRRFATLEAPAKVDALHAVTSAWKPDLLIFGSADLAAPIVAASLDLPLVNQGFGRMVPLAILELAARETESLWRDRGLTPDPLGGAFRGPYLDICPPSFQTGAPPTGTPVLRLRPTYPPDPEERLPDWVDGLDERPLIYVTLGTVFNDLSVFRVLLDALAEVDCNIVATIGRDGDPDALGSVPENAHVEQYIAQSLLLPRCAVTVGHGGSGSMLAALTEGVPLLLVPRGADQFENAERCQALGAAKVLMPDELTGESVRDAVATLLEEPSYRDRARELGAEITAMPSPEELVPAIIAAAARQ
jgi:UDP:flavonoid glycosyltransferase YjiC (YdhE family)